MQLQGNIATLTCTSPQELPPPAHHLLPTALNVPSTCRHPLDEDIKSVAITAGSIFHSVT